MVWACCLCLWTVPTDLRPKIAVQNFPTKLLPDHLGPRFRSYRLYQRLSRQRNAPIGKLDKSRRLVWDHNPIASDFPSSKCHLLNKSVEQYVQCNTLISNKRHLSLDVKRGVPRTKLTQSYRPGWNTADQWCFPRRRRSEGQHHRSCGSAEEQLQQWSEQIGSQSYSNH